MLIDITSRPNLAVQWGYHKGNNKGDPMHPSTNTFDKLSNTSRMNMDSVSLLNKESHNFLNMQSGKTLKDGGNLLINPHAVYNKPIRKSPSRLLQNS